METDYYKQPSYNNWSLTAGGQNVGNTESAKPIENNLAAKLLPSPSQIKTQPQEVKVRSGELWMKIQC